MPALLRSNFPKPRIWTPNLSPILTFSGSSEMFVSSHNKLLDSKFILQKNMADNVEVVCPFCNEVLLKVDIKAHIGLEHIEHLGFNASNIAAKETIDLKEAKTHFCRHCNIGFSSSKILTKHNETVHSKKEKAYSCDQCHKSYKLYCGLQRHKRTFHRQVRYKCDKCHKSYSDHTTLRRHQQNVHEGVKQNCNQCDRHFLSYQGLRQHKMKVHNSI